MRFLRKSICTSCQKLMSCSVEEIVERREREAVSRDYFAQLAEKGRSRETTGLEPAQLRAIAFQAGKTLLRRHISFIGEVVRRAGEPVDHRHGVTQRCRKQHGSNRKVLGVADRH